MTQHSTPPLTGRQKATVGVAVGVAVLMAVAAIWAAAAGIWLSAFVFGVCVPAWAWIAAAHARTFRTRNETDAILARLDREWTP